MVGPAPEEEFVTGPFKGTFGIVPRKRKAAALMGQNVEEVVTPPGMGPSGETPVSPAPPPVSAPSETGRGGVGLPVAPASSPVVAPLGAPGSTYPVPPDDGVRPGESYPNMPPTERPELYSGVNPPGIPEPYSGIRPPGTSPALAAAAAPTTPAGQTDYAPEDIAGLNEAALATKNPEEQQAVTEFMEDKGLPVPLRLQLEKFKYERAQKRAEWEKGGWSPLPETKAGKKADSALRFHRGEEIQGPPKLYPADELAQLEFLNDESDAMLKWNYDADQAYDYAFKRYQVRYPDRPGPREFMGGAPEFREDRDLPVIGGGPGLSNEEGSRRRREQISRQTGIPVKELEKRQRTNDIATQERRRDNLNNIDQIGRGRSWEPNFYTSPGPTVPGAIRKGPSGEDIPAEAFPKLQKEVAPLLKKRSDLMGKLKDETLTPGEKKLVEYEIDILSREITKTGQKYADRPGEDPVVSAVRQVAPGTKTGDLMGGQKTLRDKAQARKGAGLTKVRSRKPLDVRGLKETKSAIEAVKGAASVPGQGQAALDMAEQIYYNARGANNYHQIPELAEMAALVKMQRNSGVSTQDAVRAAAYMVFGKDMAEMAVKRQARLAGEKKKAVAAEAKTNNEIMEGLIKSTAKLPEEEAGKFIDKLLDTYGNDPRFANTPAMRKLKIMQEVGAPLGKQPKEEKKGKPVRTTGQMNNRAEAFVYGGDPREDKSKKDEIARDEQGNTLYQGEATPYDYKTTTPAQRRNELRRRYKKFVRQHLKVGFSQDQIDRTWSFWIHHDDNPQIIKDWDVARPRGFPEFGEAVSTGSPVATTSSRQLDPQRTTADAPTATGPNGEKVVLVNGQWVPLQ
ncbi:hypothetical protein LCGC14_0297590 [marine sediment metagenome]|uniref:Uncharacterized protein n=1 Tax=marine sediment metagenome TaxID=412755 RepID=A0A0F9WCG9_9ZZZZ